MEVAADAVHKCEQADHNASATELIRTHTSPAPPLTSCLYHLFHTPAFMPPLSPTLSTLPSSLPASPALLGLTCLPPPYLPCPTTSPCLFPGRAGGWQMSRLRTQEDRQTGGHRGGLGRKHTPSLPHTAARHCCCCTPPAARHAHTHTHLTTSCHLHHFPPRALHTTPSLPHPHTHHTFPPLRTG